MLNKEEIENLEESIKSDDIECNLLALQIINITNQPKHLKDVVSGKIFMHYLLPHEDKLPSIVETLLK